MEGPSLFLAAEQLQPFEGGKIIEVSGNTKFGKERLLGQKIHSIFSWGKYLFFQFDSFALRVHFLLFGSFEATLKGIKITGDKPTKSRIPRLVLSLKSGHIDMFSCSVHYIEDANAKAQCDFTIDIMANEWDDKKVLAKIKNYPESEISDVLLDQSIFMGVGNIIRNEVLLLTKTLPFKKIVELSPAKLKKILSTTRTFAFQFYAWRKKFELKKHYQVYRQSTCKICGGKVSRKKTGLRNRQSYMSMHCQK